MRNIATAGAFALALAGTTFITGVQAQDPAEPNIDAEFNAAIPTATAPQPATPEVRQ